MLLTDVISILLPLMLRWRWSHIISTSFLVFWPPWSSF